MRPIDTIAALKGRRVSIRFRDAAVPADYTVVGFSLSHLFLTREPCTTLEGDTGCVVAPWAAIRCVTVLEGKGG